MTTYYDRVLLGIAMSVVGGVVLGLTTAVGFRTGLFFGSTVAMLFMYDAMIRNPPLPPTDRTATVAVVIWHAVVAVLGIAAYTA